MRALGKMLALIPAKEGSTRLPRKNILPLAGKTMLERTITTANRCGVFDRIFVSTESDDVARIAGAAGVPPAFMRPPELSRDPAGVVEVCLHALEEFERLGETYDTLVILLPTSPFRKTEDVMSSIHAYSESGVDFLMSVVREVHSPLSSLVLDDGQLKPLHPEWLNQTGARSLGKRLPCLVRANGAVTIVNVSSFKHERTYYTYPLGAYEMPIERSLDIDTPLEFEFAQFLAQMHPDWLDE